MIDSRIRADPFVERGREWLDTAYCYSFWTDTSEVGGAGERVLGAWLRAGRRSTVRIATKVLQNPSVPHELAGRRGGSVGTGHSRRVDGSLERLGVEHIDLLWAHAEDRSVPLVEMVEAFGDLVARGVVGGSVRPITPRGG